VLLEELLEDEVLLEELLEVLEVLGSSQKSKTTRNQFFISLVHCRLGDSKVKY
jgi:hypothetical protein